MLAKAPLIRSSLFVCLITISLAIPSGVSIAGQWTDPHAWARGPVLGEKDPRHPTRVYKGNIVAMWQLMLAISSAANGLSVQIDGIFGPDTRAATQAWQRGHQFLVPSLVADGLVGPHTWNTARFFHVKKSGTRGDWDYYYYTDAACSGLGCNLPLSYTRTFRTWFVSTACSRDYVVKWPLLDRSLTRNCD